MAAIHERLHEEDVLLRRHVGHGHDLRRRHPGRLLAQNGSARPHRHDRQLGVEWMRRRDVDGIHVRLRRKRHVVGEAPVSRDRVCVAKPAAAGLVAAGDGHQLTRRRLFQPVGEIMRDGPRPDDAPACLAHSVRVALSLRCAGPRQSGPPARRVRACDPAGSESASAIAARRSIVRPVWRALARGQGAPCQRWKPGAGLSPWPIPRRAPCARPRFPPSLLRTVPRAERD